MKKSILTLLIPLVVISIPSAAKAETSNPNSRPDITQYQQPQLITQVGLSPTDMRYLQITKPFWRNFPEPSNERKVVYANEICQLYQGDSDSVIKRIIYDHGGSALNIRQNMDASQILVYSLQYYCPSKYQALVRQTIREAGQKRDEIYQKLLNDLRENMSNF
ncbi:MAG: hypothetical protein WBA93_25155 [Microcoleaceae cyanobacterium]